MGTPATATTAAATAPASACARAPSALADLGAVNNQQGLQGKGVGKEHQADRRTTHGHCVQCHCIAPTTHRHLHRLHVNVHQVVHRRDGALDHGAVLKLDGDCLIAQLHKE